MLTINVAMQEGFDREKQKFVTLVGFELNLEHSLVSLSKWESHFKKPFLSDELKSEEETLWYIKTMIQNKKIPPELFLRLSKKNFDDINAYIEDSMSATWFSEPPNQKKSRDIITAEIIYFWMIEFGIPTEFQHWHLNRLMTLIKVCSQKKTPPKKMSPQEIMAEQRRLNEQRKAAHGTTG